MNLDMQSMAIAMPFVAGHPNREAFRGVLTLVDVASDRAPAGARGHRVVLTHAAADAALPSLLGMGLDYSPRLDRHDAQRKIGVITRAELVGRKLELGGHLYAKDFPDIVREIALSGEKRRSLLAKEVAARSLANVGVDGPDFAFLGMSFEIADARVADTRAKVWTLTHVTFTGAAVLRRDKAAYRDTWIELE